MNKKKHFSYIINYWPWFCLIAFINLFFVLLLYLSDLKTLVSLSLVLILFSLTFFFLMVFIIKYHESKKEEALNLFLSDISKQNGELLSGLYHGKEKQNIDMLIEGLLMHAQVQNEIKTFLADYEDYVEKWAHEIKLPLSLLALVIDNQSKSLDQSLIYKLEYVHNQIHENVSQILFYYRLKTNNQDLLFEEIDLAEFIHDVLDNYKPFLVSSGFKLEVKNVKGTCFSDRRSLEFMINQIISNTLKYCRKEHPQLTIQLKELGHQKCLIFRDNGCGVKECDLAFIFEKGFSGDSLGMRKNSTGMGLYLLKELAKILNIKVEVASCWGQYFEIILYL